MNIQKMNNEELTDYISRDGTVSLDVDRLAEAIRNGRIKKVRLADGQEIDIKQVKQRIKNKDSSVLLLNV